MIITCPQCAKRYMLDDNLLPKDGRQVRCIACHHTWLQAPLEETTPILTLKEPEDIFIEQRKPLKKKTAWKSLFFLFTFVLLGTGFLIYGREIVINLWPKSEKFYELAGLSINHAGSDLAILNTSSFTQHEGPEEKIYIAGDIVNTSHQVRQIPPLKVKVLGPKSHPHCKEGVEEECLLDSWNHRLSENSLLPGEKIHFETQAHPKAPGTLRISVHF